MKIIVYLINIFLITSCYSQTDSLLRVSDLCFLGIRKAKGSVEITLRPELRDSMYMDSSNISRREFELNKTFKVCHSFPTQAGRFTGDCFDTIRIMNQSFCVQELLGFSSEDCYRPIILRGQEIWSGPNRYFIFEIGNYEEKDFLRKLILLRQDDSNRIIPILLGKEYFIINSKCEYKGDIDSDEYVELCLYKETNSLECFKIRGNSIVGLADYNICIYFSNYENYNGMFINVNKSRWIKPFNHSCNSKFYFNEYDRKVDYLR